MKFLMIGVISLFCLSAWANEKVLCRSDDRVWELSLELDSDKAQNIEFRKNGVVVKYVSEAKVDSFRYPHNRMNYDIELDGSKYLLVTRLVKKRVLQNSGAADFLLTNNPLGFEQHAETCEFTRD